MRKSSKDLDKKYDYEDIEEIVNEVVMSSSKHRKVRLIQTFLESTVDTLEMQEGSSPQLNRTLREITETFKDRLGVDD